MARPVEQEPTVTEDNSVIGGGGRRLSHPAFATIRASRVSGSTRLFDSKIRHDGFVVVSIQGAELVEGPYDDHVYGHGRAICEVAMSESQWVAFISRMNIGSGVPCTLQHGYTSNFAQTPSLPYQEDAVERLRRGAREMGASLDTDTEKYVKEITDIAASLPKGKQAALMATLDRLVSRVNSNTSFAKERLIEFSEKLVVDAKTELNAVVTGMVTQLGLNSLSDLAAYVKDTTPQLTKEDTEQAE
jgi:hypothetical protein